MFCSQSDQSPSLFEQTILDTDEEFYATFPDARDALARSTPNHDLPLSWTDSVSPTLLNFNNLIDWPQVNEHTEAQFSLYQRQFEYGLTLPVITQSPSTFDESISFAHDVRDIPIFQGHKLQRASRSPTLELINDGCELTVMRLDDSSMPRNNGTQISYFNHTNQRRAHLPSHTLTWDSGLNSPRTSIPLSPLLGKRQLERKPPLACLFCRGRKIACGPPLPGSMNKTCK